MWFSPLVAAYLSATPNSSFGVQASFISTGQHAELRPGSSLNNDVGRISRKRQKDHRAELERQRQLLVEEGNFFDDVPARRAPVVNLSDEALAELMKRLRSVDIEALDFKNCPPLGVTLNYPWAATGEQIKAIWTGVSKAIKAHPVYSAIQGEVYRELGSSGLYHEHMTLIVPDDTVKFQQWLLRRFRYHCKKQGLLKPERGALHVALLKDVPSWNSWCGYAAKKSKQEMRRNAYLPGGGAWTHRFQPLPKAPSLTIKVKTMAKFYALLALLSVHTGTPKDFRSRKVHIQPGLHSLYTQIINSVGELDVPWQIPSGVVQEEWEGLIRTSLDGKPTKLRIYYGDIYKAKYVEVGTEGLQQWGRILLRRHRKSLLKKRRPRFTPPKVKGGKPCGIITSPSGARLVVTLRERGPPNLKSPA